METHTCRGAGSHWRVCVGLFIGHWAYDCPGVIWVYDVKGLVGVPAHTERANLQATRLFLSAEHCTLTFPSTISQTSTSLDDGPAHHTTPHQKHNHASLRAVIVAACLFACLSVCLSAWLTRGALSWWSKRYRAYLYSSGARVPGERLSRRMSSRHAAGSSK